MPKAGANKLPGYLLLGAPGAGKTTVLLNSGAALPMAAKPGRGPAQSPGGTGSCDWWFTDRAVLIDTEGRYTTQDRDRVADRQAWQTCLQLLLRSRPRRPLNGVLMAVSAADLLEFTAAQLAEHARMLRARLDEVQALWRAPIPVYILLTKCDLLPGFIEWFGALPRSERDQAWGLTFDRPGTDSARTPATQFADSFAGLLDRLLDQLAPRLQAERDLQRRARIFTLPNQLRALSEPLVALIRGISGSSAASAGASSTCLRGLYLTSATQGGTPIDRMLSAFGRELGLERQILPANPGTGKSFFLTGLVNHVLLAEAEPRGGTPQQRRLVAAMASILLCAAAVASWWVTSYLRSVHDMARLEDDVRRARSVVDAVPVTFDPDPRALLPALNAVRALARAQVPTNGPAHFIDIAGQTRLELAAAAREAYDRMLLGPFQGQIAQALDAMLRPGTNTNVQYEALEVAERLNQPGHFNATGLETLVMSYWASALVPPLSRTERKNLAQHLDALQATGAAGAGIKLEPTLVDSVRSRLAAMPSAVAHGGAAPGSAVPPNSAVAHGEAAPGAVPPNNAVAHGSGVAPPRSRVMPGGADAPPNSGAASATGAPPPPVRTSPITLSRQIAARLAVPCIQLVAGHFPFDRRAVRDASFQDFSRLFAPKGTFEEVFRQLLASRVDTSSDTWRALSPGTGPNAEDLERFRSAARIRDVFFAHGGSKPGFQLTFRPLDLDPDVDRFQLEIDGQTVRYAHGPIVPTVVKWPGPQGHAHIELTPVSDAGAVDYTGPWALFRLFDHAAIQETGTPGHFRVVFDVGGRHASFDVASDTGANPFRLRELERFDCPISGR